MQFLGLCFMLVMMAIVVSQPHPVKAHATGLGYSLGAIHTPKADKNAPRPRKTARLTPLNDEVDDMAEKIAEMNLPFVIKERKQHDFRK
jgi:hypothetical protein